jgi:hypothetical protein
MKEYRLVVSHDGLTWWQRTYGVNSPVNTVPGFREILDEVLEIKKLDSPDYPLFKFEGAAPEPKPALCIRPRTTTLIRPRTTTKSPEYVYSLPIKIGENGKYVLDTSVVLPDDMPTAMREGLKSIGFKSAPVAPRGVLLGHQGISYDHR